MAIVPKVETLSPASEDARDDGHGRNADTPSDIPARGLKDVLWRVYSEVLADRVTLIAAGATYYIVLALFPGMGVLVSVYGLMTDPSDLAKQIVFLATSYRRVRTTSFSRSLRPWRIRVGQNSASHFLPAY